MTQEEFIKAITHAVTLYTNAPEYFDANPQLRINPATLDVVAINGRDMLEGIADSDEAVEDAAAAQGDETESATDFQASQDPDFYPIKEYVKAEEGGRMKPDAKAIAKLAARYIG